MNNRVVISGMGVVAPNGNTLEEFEDALRNGRSGIRRIEKMEEHKFACQIAGVPQNVDAISADRFTEEERIAMNANMTYGAIAADDAWRSAGLERPEADDDAVDWDSGAVIGTGVGGVDTVGERVVPLTNAGKVRRLGSTCVEQVMCSKRQRKSGRTFRSRQSGNDQQ